MSHKGFAGPGGIEQCWAVVLELLSREGNTKAGRARWNSFLCKVTFLCKVEVDTTLFFVKLMTLS